MEPASRGSAASLPAVWAAGIALGGVALGFVLGAVVGWPGGGAPDEPRELMCAAIAGVEPSFLERLEEGDVDLGSGDDLRSTSLLAAALDLAEATAADEGDESLRDTARRQRESLTRLQTGAVREQVAELRRHC